MTTTWTDVSKPTGTGYTNVPKPITSSIVSSGGEAIGLLLALTYATSQVVPIDIWTDISKASGTSYTNVPKAT